MSLLGHFELTAQPFGVTPDPRFIYPSATHREALSCLLHGIASDRGFTALIAEPGMGKTTLLFHLLQSLKGKARTAFLFQTLCGPREFLSALLDDLGIDDEGGSIGAMQAKLNHYLLETSSEGRQVVVIIDEAQNLDEGVLEVVRMLSNFETANRKLMHVVLAGQPQLAKKLAAENLAQLRQRISIIARLDRFGADETREYIEHRLQVAGRQSSSGPLFAKQAYALIAERSQGIPRNINNLCFNAMSLACAMKKRVVEGAMIQETVRDLELTTIAARPVSAEKETTAEASTPRKLAWQRFSQATWRRAVSLIAAAVPLICLGFVSGKALGERRAAALPERPEANGPLVPAATAAAQPLPEDASRSLDFKDAKQTQEPGTRLDAPAVVPASAPRRRSSRRVHSQTVQRSTSSAGWTAKFSSSLRPPRVAAFTHSDPGAPELEPAAQQVLLPASAAMPGDKP